jgi:hypothetical protein
VRGGTLAIVALACALGYLALFAVPAALALVVAAATIAACALALRRRRTRVLLVVQTAIAAWLVLGLLGALLLRSHPISGMTWSLVVLFVLPLPIIPWLYARTFPKDTVVPPLSPLRSPLSFSSPDPGPRTPNLGKGGGA